MVTRNRALLGAALLACGAALGGLLSCRRAAPRRLTLVVPYRLETLDPHATFSLSNLALLFNFYEPLVCSDAGMRPTPCLAERWENPDRETWIFHLRPNVRFHSGKPFDSGDVVYSFDRLRRGRDLGMSASLVAIRSVEALGARTVRIRTSGPVAAFLNEIALVAIVPAGATDARLASGEDGTGPYRLARSEPGALYLVRNPDYWGPRPYARKVTYLCDVDPARAMALVRNGAASIAQSNSRTLLDWRDPRGRYRVLHQPDVFVEHLEYDLGRPATPGVAELSNPFRDPRVRRALDLAIDRKALASSLPVPAVPAYQLAPPFVFGYDPALTPPAPDPARAASLLAQAGYPRGFSVRLDVPRRYGAAARAVADQLSRVNVRVDVREHAFSELSDLERRGEVSLELTAFGCTSGDISDLLDNVLHTAEPLRHFGLYNVFGYSNPSLDRAIEASASLDDPYARRDALQRIVRSAMDDLPILPLYMAEDVYAVDRSLSWTPRNDGIVLAQEIHPAGGNGSSR